MSSSRHVEMVFIRMVAAPPLSQYTVQVLASVIEAARAATVSIAEVDDVDVTTYYQRAFLQGGSCELELVLLPRVGLGASSVAASLQQQSSAV